MVVIFPVVFKVPVIEVFPVTFKVPVALRFVPVKLVIIAAGPEKDVVALTVAPLILVVPTISVPVTDAEDRSVVNLPVVPEIFVPDKLVALRVVMLPVVPAKVIPVTEAEDRDVVNLPTSPETEGEETLIVPLMLVPVTLVALKVLIPLKGLLLKDKGPTPLAKTALTELYSIAPPPAIVTSVVSVSKS